MTTPNTIKINEDRYFVLLHFYCFIKIRRRKNNKWVTANKKKVIDDVIQKSYDLLDEKYTDNKDDISEKRQERFQNFQEKYEQADEELLRNIKNDVDLLLINGTT